MAVLDKFVQAMFQNSASALRMQSGQAVMLEVDGNDRPVTKEALTKPKIMALVREIAPDGMKDHLDAESRMAFGYVVDGKRVDVELMHLGPNDVQVSIGPAKPRRSSAAIAMPMEAMMAAAAAAVPESAPRAASVRVSEEASAAEERIQEMLTKLVKSGSSDLHLRVGEPPIIRKSGEMQRLEGYQALTVDEMQALLFSIMPERNKKEWTETNDTDFAYEILGLARFRGNVLKDRKGPAAVFRVIPTKIQTVEELGVTEEVQKLCFLSKGLVLVTGPTGSGKSTTLAAMIDLINRKRTDHIITIEDPIEFVHENKSCIITQRQVALHTQSFKRALRAALREDPDIVLVGEMRDLETIEIAIETAETGHLVFGTLHTTTAPSTIDRIIDQFPADRQSQIRVMLSESLKGVVAQVLVKRIGGGRAAAREILIAIPAISNLIREGKTFQIPSMMQTNKKLGMVTMNDALFDLVDKKIVEPYEAWIKSVDKTAFEGMLKAKGHDLSFLKNVQQQ
ncbi:MAG TPA: type IV pilus twitching motility protein PilT [Gemmatimonadales bacterium]|nr:type IV pilus twitching motility protein PilT [Gemmatimonadales bacterium]